MAVDWRAIATAVLRSVVRTGGRQMQRAPRRAARAPGRSSSGAARAAYPGDFTGTARLEYAPRADALPDPGEVVWTWVPYEEDHSRGKDRPVLVVARDGGWLLALMLTSKDHDGPGTRGGDEWLDIGTGPWDRQGRPSEVRVDRVLRVDPAAVRREGAQLAESRFDLVAARLRSLHGWA